MLTDPNILIRKCLEKDPRAQQELYEQYASKMYGICLRYFPNEDDAKEAFQEGWIKVFLNLHRFRAKSLISTWMHTIFVNTSIDFLKARIKEGLHLSVNEEILEKADDDISDLEETDIDLDEALTLLERLPEKYRTVLNLYAIDGHSHADISRMLGISENASRTQLSRARLMIKEIVKKSQLKHEAIKPSYR